MSEEPKKKVWLVSTDEEDWDCTVEFDSKEDAIKNGPAELMLEAGDYYWVGYKKECLTRDDGIMDDFDIAECLSQIVSERTSERACGDWPIVSNDQALELRTALNDVVFAWLDKHDMWPDFYGIEGSTGHTLCCERHRDEPDSLPVCPE